MPGGPRQFASGLSSGEIRRAMGWASANAGLWAVGNGLISTTLVIYLALDLGARGTAVSFIVAAPRLAGLLRLSVPAILARLRHRKTICIVAYILSSIVLCALPWLAAPGRIAVAETSIALLVLTWCLYHFLEYVGSVSLWSWLGDLTPRRVRGRLFGLRERFLTLGVIGGICASVLLTLAWRRLMPDAARWEPLAASAAAGAVLMALAALPLMMMPGIEQSPSARPHAPWATLLRALAYPPYRRLISFACCLSAANGITAVAQSMYPLRVLGIDYVGFQALQGAMRGGQSALAPAMGRLVDRWGSRPVMTVSQLIVATGPLFFLIATPEQRWWIAGAYVVWVAYVGMNVGTVLRLCCWEDFLTVGFRFGEGIPGRSRLRCKSPGNWGMVPDHRTRPNTCRCPIRLTHPGADRPRIQLLHASSHRGSYRQPAPCRPRRIGDCPAGIGSG